MNTLRSILGLIVILVVATTLSACGGFRPAANAKANQPLKQETVNKLAAMGSSPAAPMMIRIIKQSNELEVWKEARGTFKLFKTYEICAWSGALGPKIKEGDRQSPEGFYTITPGLMNPNSNYYLAFNTGFPNKFDRAWGRTGSDLMVHGDCSSRGCYSMTDESIAEIYALARETFKGGNPSFQLQIFPFRMTATNLARNADSPSLSFWKDIKEGYDSFELTRRPPTWDVCNKEYVFNVPGETALEAAASCPAAVAQAVPAELRAKMAADDAEIARQIAALEDKAAKAAVEAERAAAAEAEARARGEAIGDFIGGLFGGGDAAKVIDPSKVAPVPAPRLHRA
ncbi:L,D-transpeptidase family protein [Devosia sp.]|uniref:L,D-transpeptidase family protein n=1 Tax=Devosia sp. TaxID=1871048 RepID=UPI0035B48F7C